MSEKSNRFVDVIAGIITILILLLHFIEQFYLLMILILWRWFLKLFQLLLYI